MRQVLRDDLVGEALQDAASPGVYGQPRDHEGPKMQGKSPGNGRQHAAEPRVNGREEIRRPAGGKPANCLRLNFLVIHRGKDRHQTPKSAVCHGLAAVTETRRSPLLFVPSGVVFNSQRYIADILEGCLRPWAKKHFQGVPWSQQQGSAPSHASKITQS